MYRMFIAVPGTEFTDQLHRGAEFIERRDLEYTWIAEIHDAVVLILLQQRIKHCSRLRSVLTIDVLLADTFRALTPGSRGTSVRNMADEVKWIKFRIHLI